MKYIIAGRLRNAVIFDEWLSHTDVARALFPYETIHGAGFCKIVNNEYEPYGKSTSLGIGVGPDDKHNLNGCL